MHRTPTKDEILYIQGLLWKCINRRLLGLLPNLLFIFISVFTGVYVYLTKQEPLFLLIFLIALPSCWSVLLTMVDNLVGTRLNWKRDSLLSCDFDIIDVTVREFSKQLKRGYFDGYEVYATDAMSGKYTVKNCIGLAKDSYVIRLKHKKKLKSFYICIPKLGEDDYCMELSEYYRYKYISR